MPQLVKIQATGYSRTEYVGTVEKMETDKILLKLANELDENKNPVFRNLKKANITSMIKVKS